MNGEVHTGQGSDGLQVLVRALAENEGGRGVGDRRVGDRVGLSGLDGLGENVDLEGGGGSNEGGASEEGLEETHVG